MSFFFEIILETSAFSKFLTMSALYIPRWRVRWAIESRHARYNSILKIWEGYFPFFVSVFCPLRSYRSLLSQRIGVALCCCGVCRRRAMLMCSRPPVSQYIALYEQRVWCVALWISVYVHFAKHIGYCWLLILVSGLALPTAYYMQEGMLQIYEVWHVSHVCVWVRLPGPRCLQFIWCESLW